MLEGVKKARAAEPTPAQIPYASTDGANDSTTQVQMELQNGHEAAVQRSAGNLELQWSITRPVGGQMLDLDPVFSKDEKQVHSKCRGNLVLTSQILHPRLHLWRQGLRLQYFTTCPIYSDPTPQPRRYTRTVPDKPFRSDHRTRQWAD